MVFYGEVEFGFVVLVWYWGFELESFVDDGFY